LGRIGGSELFHVEQLRHLSQVLAGFAKNYGESGTGKKVHARN
jgi:hypothetical protein